MRKREYEIMGLVCLSLVLGLGLKIDWAKLIEFELFRGLSPTTRSFLTQTRKRFIVKKKIQHPISFSKIITIMRKVHF